MKHIIYLAGLCKVTCVCMTNPLNVCTWVRLRESGPLKSQDKKRPLEQAVEKEWEKLVWYLVGPKSWEISETCRGHEDIVWENVSTIKGYWEIWLTRCTRTADSICLGTQVCCARGHVLGAVCAALRRDSETWHKELLKCSVGGEELWLPAQSSC